jgi:hypothetical protein
VSAAPYRTTVPGNITGRYVRNALPIAIYRNSMTAASVFMAAAAIASQSQQKQRQSSESNALPKYSNMTHRHAVCNGAAEVTFLNVLMPAKGAVSECTLSPGTHKEWPTTEDAVAAARRGIFISQIGNHATFQDFLEGMPSASRSLRRTLPIGKCKGDVWTPGGHACERTVAGRVCTPLVTWLYPPVDSFLSTFFEGWGADEVDPEDACRMLRCRTGTQLAELYRKGKITPDLYVFWESDRDVSAGWNAATRRIGDATIHRYDHTNNERRGLRDDERGREALALAKRRLHSMDFVGLGSRFHDSVTLLSWWLGLPPLNVTCEASMERPNHAQSSLSATLSMMKGSKSRPRLSSAAEAELKRQNALDVELYAEAERIFEARWLKMQEEAPERIQADRYRCQPTRTERCRYLHSERSRAGQIAGHLPIRCSTYCTNRATEAVNGASLRTSYEAQIECGHNSDLAPPGLERVGDGATSAASAASAASSAARSDVAIGTSLSNSVWCSRGARMLIDHEIRLKRMASTQAAIEFAV